MGRIKNFNQHISERQSPKTGDSSSYLDRIKVVTKGDKDVAQLAREQVGDGKEPNVFFVTVSNDYMFFNNDGDITFYSDDFKNGPVKIEDQIEVETFMFENFKDAMKKIDETDLDQEVGPRYIMLEDRKTGMIYEKYLKAERKIIWSDEVNDDTKRFGYK